MIEGIHIEMDLLKNLGDWLNGSRWASVMMTANVTTIQLKVKVMPFFSLHNQV